MKEQDKQRIKGRIRRLIHILDERFVMTKGLKNNKHHVKIIILLEVLQGITLLTRTSFFYWELRDSYLKKLIKGKL